MTDLNCAIFSRFWTFSPHSRNSSVKTSHEMITMRLTFHIVAVDLKVQLETVLKDAGEHVRCFKWNNGKIHENFVWDFGQFAKWINARSDLVDHKCFERQKMKKKVEVSRASERAELVYSNSKDSNPLELCRRYSQLNNLSWTSFAKNCIKDIRMYKRVETITFCCQYYFNFSRRNA